MVKNPTRDTTLAISVKSSTATSASVAVIYYDSIAGTSTTQADPTFALTVLSSFGRDIFSEDGTFNTSVAAVDLQFSVDDPVASANDVPEPSEVGLLGMGALLIVGGLGFRRRKMALVG